MTQYEYVDLGLPSGLKWAKCNVGAASETDYGDYFMWGSTKPNTADECNWVTYKYYNGSEDTLTKYNTYRFYGTVDNITTLESVDDAATQIMGSDWRMPTKTDFQELIDKTNHEWVTNFNGSGVDGCKFTSKKDTSKYIFIPATGSVWSGSVNRVDRSYVWGSSLYDSYPDQSSYLFSDSYDAYGIGDTYRHVGQTVRGVHN